MSARKILQKARASRIDNRQLTSIVSNASASACIDQTFDSADPHRETKSMYDLKGPAGWPILGNFITYVLPKNAGRVHEVQEMYHKQYGKMFREKWGVKWQVHVSDPSLIAEVYRKQGRHPNRPPIAAWKLDRESRQRSHGLITADGTTWQRFRSEVNKRMMCPHSSRDLVEPFSDVADTLVTKLRHIRDTEGSTSLSQRVQNELYKWGMESAGTFLFEKRLGCLDISIKALTQEFVDSILGMMESSLKVIVYEKWHKRLGTPMWKTHKQHWDKIFEIGEFYIEERLKRLAEEQTAGKGDLTPKKGAFLTYLLSKENLSRDEIYSNVTELFLGSIDTTANSIAFTLHLLANNEEVQQKTREEVNNVLQGRAQVTADDIDKMPYLKAVIRESQRLYPVATMNCRILDEDITLDGYHIPKNTLFVLNHYTASRCPQVFDEPTRFVPERWLRDRGSKPHPFAALPFGFGVRSCIGQRVAKMEMCVVLAKMMLNFNLRPDPSHELRPILRTLLTSGESLPVLFEDR